MPAINDEIENYLETVTDVSEANPQIREYQNTGIQVRYYRTGTRTEPTHDCSVLRDALWWLDIFGSDHEKVTDVAETIFTDLEAGSGAVTESQLKLHLPRDYEEVPMNETDLPDTKEYMARIEMRTIR